MKTAWIALGVLCCGAAWAQPEPLPERLYVHPGVLIGSSRMIALGGAYAGMAEGSEGAASNLAAIVNRTPTENGPRQISPAFTLNWALGDNDFDNDGENDSQNIQVLGGLQARFRRFALGAFGRYNQLAFCLTEGCTIRDPSWIGVAFARLTLAAGYSFLDENLIASVGLVGDVGRIFNEGREWPYHGIGPELGILVRPKGMPFRVGIAARPTIVSHYTGNGSIITIQGRQIHSGFVSPGVYSFGVSFKVGEGAFAYNDLPSIEAPPPSRALDARSPIWDMVRNRDDPKNGRLLVTLQLDLITGVENALPIRAFIREQPPVPVGSRLMYLPRIGLEHRAIPGRFKVRLGSYLEPSPYEDRDRRIHVTGGAELFVFRLIDDWSSTLTFDVARQYANVGISIGFWR